MEELRYIYIPKFKKADDDACDFTPVRWYRQTTCVKKKEGLTSVEDSVNALIRGVEDYIKNSKEILINSTGNNSEETEMGRKTTVWIFYGTNWQSYQIDPL